MTNDRPHRPRALAALFLFSLAVQVALAWPIQQPGTMDSHYYYGGGRSLLENRAFVEPYIWNFLDDPAGLPAPSHLYWMPLPSILVAISQAILGPSFKAGQVPFILLAAGLPLVSYATSWTLSRNRRHALAAGLLTIFSGFFVPYWSLPETFAPFAVTGGLALYALGRWAENGRTGWILAAGLLAGLCHLCRADGMLLLVAGLAAVLFGRPPTDRRQWRAAVGALALFLLGYLAVMTPWFVRNWRVIGAPLATAGTKTIFLRSYDELFSYGTPLTPQRYLEWGWGNILRSKLTAGWSNLQTFVAVNNLVFLTPLTLIGFWRERHRRIIWPAVLYGVALYAIMTLLFTFPGARGGVFHSSAALLPFVFSISMVGLDAAVDWVAQRRRQWNRRTAQRFFTAGALVLAAGLSLFIYSRRVVGNGSWSRPAWNQTDSAMVEIGKWIEAQGGERPVVMVGNPPAFYYHTGLPSVAVPNEGVEQVVAAARRYGVSYLILDHNHPRPLANLFGKKETSEDLEPVADGFAVDPSQLGIFRVTRNGD